MGALCLVQRPRGHTVPERHHRLGAAVCVPQIPRLQRLRSHAPPAPPNPQRSQQKKHGRQRQTRRGRHPRNRVYRPNLPDDTRRPNACPATERHARNPAQTGRAGDFTRRTSRYPAGGVSIFARCRTPPAILGRPANPNPADRPRTATTIGRKHGLYRLRRLFRRPASPPHPSQRLVQRNPQRTGRNARRCPTRMAVALAA